MKKIDGEIQKKIRMFFTEMGYANEGYVVDYTSFVKYINENIIEEAKREIFEILGDYEKDSSIYEKVVKYFGQSPFDQG